MDPKTKTLTLMLEDLEEFELEQLAQFLKRVHFDDCYRKSDSGYPEPQRNDQAYAMIAALEAVRRALSAHGYCPR